MVNKNLYFAGIEGGATHSNIVLVDADGQQLSTAEGPSTNFWLIGLVECAKRIKGIVDDVKSNAGLADDVTLEGLGLCLSGCESENSNNKLKEAIHSTYPLLTRSIFIASDTIGSLSTACREGGMILISGTGSNCLLMNPDGQTYQSGGWGHMLGDEGGAYWIAARAVKLVFDEDDYLIEPLYCTDILRKLVFDHFELKDRFGILEHCYGNFRKEKYASLTAKISGAATAGDLACIQLMTDAGNALGRYVSALSKKMDPQLFEQPRGLEIVCSGSVFKSWDLLKEGFLQGVQPKNSKDVVVPKFTLLRLKVTSAFGAIYKCALQRGHELPRQYESNSQVFFCHDAPISNGHVSCKKAVNCTGNQDSRLSV